MAENSVNSYIDAQPEQAMDFEEYWKLHGNGESSNSIGNRFFNFLFGTVDHVKNQYQTYLDNLNNRNEFLAAQSARAYEKMMDDTKYQRMMKDFEAAGLNPYLLINNGGISASSAPSAAKANYNNSKRDESKKSSGRDIALLLIGVARLAAALL